MFEQGEDLYSILRLDPEKMNQLINKGFSEQDSRLGLRACSGNVDMAIIHIKRRKEVRGTHTHTHRHTNWRKIISK